MFQLKTKSNQIFKLNFLVLIATAFLNIYSEPAFAQEINFDNKKTMITSGMSNYGYESSIYYQFSGDPLFEESNPPDSLFTNVNILYISELDIEYLEGYAYGFEFMRYSTNSENSYLGTDEARAPSIIMVLYLWSITTRIYFKDPMTSTLQPYFGAGWGMTSGSFDTTMLTGENYLTTYSGLLNYRSIGTQFYFSDSFGISVELRSVTSNTVVADSDPFLQIKEGDKDLTLDFGGTMLNFNGVFRF